MNTSRSKWLWITLAGVAAAAALWLGYGQLMSRSDAVLLARHAPPPSAVTALTTPAGIARGAHLVTVTACGGCHGQDLAGGPLYVSGTQDYTPNLTRLAARRSDAELDRAIRQGLRPDGTSELVMPAQAYARFTDDEVAAIIGYLRSLPPKGADAPKLQPGLLLRATLLTGGLKTAVQQVATARGPVDAGPATAEGRHLAQIACGRCHGTDLGGISQAGSDLTVDGYFTYPQFYALIRRGEAIGEGNMKLMTDTAQASFSHFTDGETDALYAYLLARDHILAARAAAAKGR